MVWCALARFEAILIKFLKHIRADSVLNLYERPITRGGFEA
jgi:hypothetical protein